MIKHDWHSNAVIFPARCFFFFTSSKWVASLLDCWWSEICSQTSIGHGVCCGPLHTWQHKLTHILSRFSSHAEIPSERQKHVLSVPRPGVSHVVRREAKSDEGERIKMLRVAQRVRWLDRRDRTTTNVRLQMFPNQCSPPTHTAVSTLRFTRYPQRAPRYLAVDWEREVSLCTKVFVVDSWCSLCWQIKA